MRCLQDESATYETYEDFIKHMYRATRIVQILNEIPDWFARNYIHYLNPAIYLYFGKQVFKLHKVLKLDFDIKWSKDIFDNRKKIAELLKILNKSIGILQKDLVYSIKFWKSIQKDRDYLIKL